MPPQISGAKGLDTPRKKGGGVARKRDGEKSLPTLIPMVLYTVWFFPYYLSGALIFRGTLPLSSEREAEILWLLAFVKDPYLRSSPLLKSLKPPIQGPGGPRVIAARPLGRAAHGPPGAAGLFRRRVLRGGGRGKARGGFGGVSCGPIPRGQKMAFLRRALGNLSFVSLILRNLEAESLFLWGRRAANRKAHSAHLLSFRAERADLNFKKTFPIAALRGAAFIECFLESAFFPSANLTGGVLCKL
jgi:hypothetical protein